MKTEHIDWIRNNVPRDGYGQCKKYSSLMTEVFDELEQVRGHYHCPVWGKRGHWWCVVKGTDKIVDPTSTQFPSSAGRYVELDPAAEVPVDRCLNCGELCYASKGGERNWCSERCCKELKEYYGGSPSTRGVDL